MSSTIDAIKALEDRQHARLRDDYLALLKRAAVDELPPSELEMVAGLVDRAGKTAADFAADVERMRERLALARVADTAPDWKAAFEAAADEARRVDREHLGYVQAAAARREEAMRVAKGEAGQAHSRLQEAMQAADRIKHLDRKDPIRVKGR